MRAVTWSSLFVLALAWGCHESDICADVPCVDADGDGVCADCCAGRPCDCDDDDPLAHPGSIDAHRDGYDFDCDGTDLGGEGTPCASDAECSGRCNPDTATCTHHEERCDGFDGDGDLRLGCADLDCASRCDTLVAEACGGATDASSGSGSFLGAPALFPICGALVPQVIHRFTPGLPGERGELVLHHTGVDVLELRSDCATSSGPGCIPTDGPAMLVVDGGVELFAILGGNASHYTFDFTFTAAVCGDGVVTAPESCDDGDAEGGDGCDASCQIENAFDPCTLAVDTALGITTASTEGGSGVMAGSCGGLHAPERLHRIVPPATGTLQIAVTSEAPLTVYALASSCYGPELGCSEGSSLSTLPAVAGEPIIVVVDGESPGGYTLVAHLLE